MAGSKKLPVRAGWTIFFCLIFVFSTYLTLQGNQGIATQVVTQGQYAYVTMGEFGGIGIYEIRRPRPNLINLPNQSSTGKARVITRPFDKSFHHKPNDIGLTNVGSGNVSQIVLFNNWLFAINPSYGFSIFDNTNPQNPIEVNQIEFFGIRDFTIYENLGFIAAGRNGIYLLDLRDPMSPHIIDHYDTPGFAERIFPVSLKIQTVSIQNQDQQEIRTEVNQQRFMAYVADGEMGLILVDFISNLPEASRFNVVNRIAIPGYTQDIYFDNNFIFVAVRSTGVNIYDAITGGDNPINPRPLGTVQTGGETLQVVYHRGFMYIADGTNGLVVGQVVNQGGSVNVNILYNLAFPGGVSSLDIQNDVALLTSGVQGVNIVNIGSPFKPTNLAQLNTPGLATTTQIIQYIWNPDQNWEKIQASLLDMAKEISFAGMLFLFWLVFLSPFALPYSNVLEFWRATGDFLKHILGNMGKAVLIEDGQVLADPAMQDYSTNRPLILDNASAGLVMDQSGAMRVIGPGADLLKPGEAIVKAADLRTSTVVYGPADEDPYLPQQPSEDETMFRQRLQRRIQTAAQTRDGVEISPNIIVEYGIKQVPRPPRNPFGFHPTYALQALRQDYAMDKSNVDSDINSDLNRLPADLAVQVWRETLKQFDMEKLFLPTNTQDPIYTPSEQFGLQKVIAYVNRSLTNQYIETIEENGSPSGNMILSEAYNELEYAGLAVKRVWIVNLHVCPDREYAFFRNWINAWPKQVDKTAAILTARYQEVGGMSLQQAIMDFAEVSNKPLYEGRLRYRSLPEQFLNLNRSLHLLVTGTRNLSGLRTSEKLKLDKLIAWLERKLEI